VMRLSRILTFSFPQRDYDFVKSGRTLEKGEDAHGSRCSLTLYSQCTFDTRSRCLAGTQL
jgi:hypothetical protein